MKKLFDEICVVGLGFVGLTTALSFADKNYKVIGIDKDEKLIKSLENSQIPFFEPFLNKKLNRLKKKNFSIYNQFKLQKNKRYLWKNGC